MPAGDSGKSDSTIGADARLPDGALIDTGKPSGDGAHDTISLFDTELVCDDAGTFNTCDSVTDLGSIAIGSTKSVDGNVPLKGGDVWYKVTFDGYTDTKARPHIAITGPTGAFGFHFEITKSCGREAFTCGETEDATSTSLTSFESTYTDAAPPDDPDADAFVPLPFGTGGVMYLRVFRSGGTPTDCKGFTLDLSN